MKKLALLVCFGMIFGVSVLGCKSAPPKEDGGNGKSGAKVCSKCKKPMDQCVCKKSKDKKEDNKKEDKK